MRYLLLILAFSIGNLRAQSDTTKYGKSYDYGWRYQRVYTPLVFAPPQDTIYGKWGLAMKGNSLFLGNGNNWRVIGGTSIDTASYVKRTELLDSLSSVRDAYQQYTNDYVNENNVAYIDPILATKVNISDSTFRYITPTQLSTKVTTNSEGVLTGIKATSSAGITIKANSGSTVATFGQGGGANANIGNLSVGTAISFNSKRLADTTDLTGLATTSSVNAALNNKLNISDTVNMRVRLAAGNNINLTGTYPNITVTSASDATKLNISDTAAMLNGRLSSITLNTSSAIHTNPITFNRLGGAWSGTMTLANQSPFTVFRRASGTGVPSFGSIDSSYFNNQFATQVRAASGATTGTLSQRLALTPTVGQQFYQTNENEGLYIYNGQTWLNGNAALLFQEEFLSNYSGQTSLTLPYFIGGNSGTSANFTTPTGVSNNFTYGYVQMNTGTTTTGLSRIYYNLIGTSTNIHYANAVTYTEYLVYIPTLSDATETYVLKVGDESNVTQTASSNNTQFRYTHSENSGAWSVQYRTNNGTGTNVTTGVTVAAATWYRLGIKRIFPNDMVSGTLTIEFYINGTLTNSVAASPVWYIGVPAFVGIFKSAGTTSRSVILDYIKHYKLR